jgi:enoyl-CoA hydratase/carnithine racemase
MRGKTMPGKTVTVDRIDVGDEGAQLGVVTMNRPGELNPIDWDTGLALGRVFDELASDKRIRVVAVTGAGRAFSAGGDMKKYQVLQRDRRDFPRFLADLHEVFSRISRYPQPFVALVNGVAVAGGLELLLSCDLAIAAASARIGDAHLAFGQMGGGGVLTLLPRTVGPARARELIFSGRMLSPDEAADWGLVSSVVGDGELIKAATDFATEVAKKSPLAVANAKQVLNAALWEGTGVAAGLRLERETTARYCLTSDDAYEGLIAFAEKRRPQFRGQ